MENAHRIKDRINQLEFEINRLKNRKMNCGSDVNCIAKVENEIRIREDEIRDLKFSISLENDEKIDSDNNDTSRDRQNRFTFDKDCVE